MIRKTIYTFASREFLRFCLVGGISTVLNYAVFYFLLQLKIQYLFSSAFGYICGVFIGYLLNRKYTFRTKSPSHVAELIKYLSIYTISLFLGLGFLKFQVTVGIDVLLANVFTIGLTTVTNFLGTKFIVFRVYK